MSFTHDDLLSGRVSGISTIREETDELSSKSMTVIELSVDIRAKIFATFLQFLYTGMDVTFFSKWYCTNWVNIWFCWNIIGVQKLHPFSNLISSTEITNNV